MLNFSRVICAEAFLVRRNEWRFWVKNTSKCKWMHSRIDHLWRALDARRGECKETKRTSSDTHRKELSNGIVYASFSFELSWFLCVENVRLSREKKRRFLSKVTVGLSGFLQFYAVKSAIYIRAQIYIYTLWRGKSRKRRGDDGGNDEREEEEGWAERRVGFNREVRWCEFQTHSPEVESNGFEILVRSEYGDEKVD